MDDTAIAEIRKALLEQRERIIDKAVDALESSKSREQEAGLDSLDVSAEESLESTNLRLRDREKKLISKIHRALERMDEGEYALCEGCGEEIGERRLRARPVTTYCIECKEEQEREEARLP